MKTLELLLTVVFVVAAGVALLGGIAVVLGIYIHLRLEAVDFLSARWYARRPRRVGRTRPVDSSSVQYKRAVRNSTEEYFRLSKRRVLLVIVAAGVFVVTGFALNLLA